ncbi:chemotaxis protein CheW [Actinotalea sp. M2MS4P-6]|uniref:chemotaxis protein CheW n=1 Tax=Actinotalea sp. M2MS4P-6 TaxID=2983762 RepID=UPI0021E36FD7|nr:chemotaxis protein CheW [Actinotalea sp. M2MS4P-6]MCV2396503.1 chemotaxis protein CheW [Actinotalea sp. M2MS4P-6]
MATIQAPVHQPAAVNQEWHALNTVRWAPAPRWEGSAAKKTRFAAYLVGSMLAWIAIGLGASAALGGLVGLGG